MVTRYKALEERSDYRFLRHDAGAVGDRETFLSALLGLQPINGGDFTKAAQIVSRAGEAACFL